MLNPTTKFRHISWDAEFIKSSLLIRHSDFGIPVQAKRIAYPLRIMRYWFMCHLLREETARLGRKIVICEAGVDRGQSCMPPGNTSRTNSMYGQKDCR